MVHILYTIIVINLIISLSNFSGLINTAVTLPASFAPPEEKNSYMCNKGDNSTHKALKEKTTATYFIFRQCGLLADKSNIPNMVIERASMDNIVVY